MKFFFKSLILFSTSFALAKASNTDSWSTFQSNYGYAFTYPKCWEVRNDTPDDGELKSIMSLTVAETKACKTLKQNENFVHEFGFLFSGKLKTEHVKEEVLAKLDYSKIKLKNKEWLIFKKLNLRGNGIGTVYVEYFGNQPRDIRWIMDLYCPTRKFRIVAGAILNPSKAILRKFEQGDLGLPEPEKMILESIRCIDPKAE